MNTAFKKFFMQPEIPHSVVCRFQSKSYYSCRATDYDVVISGGGMVGFAAASAIGRSAGKSSRFAEKKILLLESQKNKTWKLPLEYSNRVCAINPETKLFFKKLGVWEDMCKMRTQPVSKMQVWEACSDAMISFDEIDAGEVIAHIIENDVTLDALKRNMPSHVEVVHEAKVKQYQLPVDLDNDVSIILKDDVVISAKMLVGADGANSLVRQTMGAKYFTVNYDQMAIVATLELSEECPNTTAWQKFLPNGPIAILPLSSKRSSLVWSTTKNEAKHLMKLPEDLFTDALNRAMWDDSHSIPNIQNMQERWRTFLQSSFVTSTPSVRQLPPSISKLVDNSRGCFPLGFGHSVQYTAPRVALVGDAAHRFHPLAGQGVNLGFGDVKVLVEMLEKSVIAGAKLGDPNYLSKYESSRQQHNLPTMLCVDSLHRLYTTTFAPVVFMRSIGLTGLDAFTWAKKKIINHASS